MKIYNILFVMLILGLVVLSACTQSQPNTPASQPVVSAPVPADEDIQETVVVGQDVSEPAVKTETQKSNVKEFDIVARQWSFSPETITVNQGDTVLLHVQSIDVAHGFSLSVFGINERLNPGEMVDIEFVADKKGVFDFRCTVFCGSGHRGMTGRLVVN